MFFNKHLNFNFFTDLEKSLKGFIDKETINYYDELSENEINSALNGTTDVEDIIKIWEKSFKEVIITPFCFNTFIYLFI